MSSLNSVGLQKKVIYWLFWGNTGIIIGIWIIGDESFITLEEMENTVLTQRRAEDPQTELMII